MRTHTLILLVALLVALVGATIGRSEAPPGYDRAEQRAKIGGLLKSARAYHHAGHHDSTQAVLMEVRSLDENNQDAFYLSAISHLAASDTAAAIVILEDGIERTPMSSRLNLLLARLCILGRDFAEAESLLKTVFRYKFENPEALYLSGLMSLEQGDTTSTLNSWKRSLERAGAKARQR